MRLFAARSSLLPALAGRPVSREKADVLLLLTACTLVLLPHIAHLPAWVFPACAVLMLWRGWITFRGNRMPPRWVLIPISLAAMAGVFLTYRTLLGREAGVAMLTLLLALKLLEMHARRDLFVALFLSFFLILSSFFYSQSIGTALMTLAAVVAILTVQVSFQYTGKVPSLLHRLRLGATILLLAVPVTLALFLLFPRIQGPLWGLPSDAHAGLTGMSDTMEPGNISKLALSDAVAFRVRFEDPLPAQAGLYWRGPVLGSFDGRSWSPLRQRRHADASSTVNVRGAPVRYQVTLEPHGKQWIFALDLPGMVPQIKDHPVIVSRDMELRSMTPVTERIRYDAVSHMDYVLAPDETPPMLMQWLYLPRGINPRTLAYAGELRASASRDTDIIRSVLRLFREENFRYTLEPPPLGANGIDDFLFVTRAGFCEHYSAAFVVLMRAAGIPARAVTGYQGGELNRADGFLVVRQSDAHAWAEVWLEGRGWVRVDPTAAVAPERVERGLSSALPRSVLGGLITLDGSDSGWLGQLRRASHAWDAITNAWNQRVLNYTPQQQRRFIESLGFGNLHWHAMAILMILVAALAVAIVILPLLLRERRRDPVDALYDRLCRRLAGRGLARAPHEGPRSYGARLTSPSSPLAPEQKAALARFLELYETVRYGATDLARPAAVSRLKSLLAECR